MSKYLDNEKGVVDHYEFSSSLTFQRLVNRGSTIHERDTRMAGRPNGCSNLAPLQHYLADLTQSPQAFSRSVANSARIL